MACVSRISVPPWTRFSGGAVDTVGWPTNEPVLAEFELNHYRLKPVGSFKRPTEVGLFECASRTDSIVRYTA